MVSGFFLLDEVTCKVLVKYEMLKFVKPQRLSLLPTAAVCFCNGQFRL